MKEKIKKVLRDFIIEGTLHSNTDISDDVDYIVNIIKENPNISEVNFLLELRDYFNKKDILFTTNEEIKRLSFNYAVDEGKNEYGINGAFIASNLKIFIIINPKELIESIKNNYTITFNTILKVLNHELVHREQYKRIGDKLYWLLNKQNSKSKELSDYYRNPREIMAFAKTVIDELRTFFNKEQISDFLRYGKRLTHNHNLMKGFLNEKEYKKFLIYMYNYNNK